MSTTKIMGRKALATLGASLITATAIPALAPAQAMAQETCTPVRVITTLGTGGSTSDKSTAPTEGVAPGYNITEELSNRFGADKISGWNTNYPSSVGAISVFWPLMGMPGGYSQVGFGNSIREGVQKTNAEISRYKSACPNSKFVLVGYSQGASVSGDVARDIAAGRVPGVTSDDITNVLLIADPGRSSNSAYESYTGKPSTLYGEIPPGTMGKNFEIISPSTGALPDRVGWTGERPGRFDGMYGKVLSLCAADDLACSAPPNSFLRALADYAMDENNINNPASGDLGPRIGKAVQLFQNKGGIQAAQAGDINRVQQLLAEAVATANLTIADIPAAISLVQELSNLISMVQQTCGKIDVKEVIGSVLVYTLPTIIKNNLTVQGLKSLYDMAPGDIKALIDTTLSQVSNGTINANTILTVANTPLISKVINLAMGRLSDLIVNPMVAWVGAQLGVDPNNQDFTSFGQQFAYLLGFPIAHGSYWHSTMINGQTAADYSRNWIIDSVGNALAGRSYQATPKARNLTDPNLEKPIETKDASGKAICNPDAPIVPAPTTDNPSVPGTTEPSTPGTTEPSTPGTTNPKTPGTTEPSAPGTTEPSRPSEPTDGNQAPSTTKPATPGTDKPAPGNQNSDSTETEVDEVPGNGDSNGPANGNGADDAPAEVPGPDGTDSASENRGLLASTGANVLALFTIAMGMVMLAGAVVTRRRI